MRQRGAAWLVLSGACAFTVGALVYLTDRGGSALWLDPRGVAVGSRWFGALGAWIPSFVHPFAFGLFSAATAPTDGRRVVAVCGFWWIVNVASEAAQHPLLKGPVARLIDEMLGRNPLTLPFTRFVMHGTFDVGDLAAATAGAVVAALICVHIGRRAVGHAVR